MKAVVAEDILMFREVVAKVCRESGHEVVGETDAAAKAVDLCATVRPDLLVLDLVLSGGDGFSVIDAVEKLPKPPVVLVVSAHCDAYTIMRLDRACVVGFVDKGSNSLGALREALWTIGNGRAFFCPRFRSVRERRQAEIQKLRSMLTEWECDILRLIGAGLSDDEIARRLGIASRTAQGHRSALIRKIGVKGTPKLMAYALQNGFSRLGDERTDTDHDEPTAIERPTG